MAKSLLKKELYPELIAFRCTEKFRKFLTKQKDAVNKNMSMQEFLLTTLKNRFKYKGE